MWFGFWILHLFKYVFCLQVKKLKGEKEYNSITMYDQCEEYNSMKDEEKVSCMYSSSYIQSLSS